MRECLDQLLPEDFRETARLEVHRECKAYYCLQQHVRKRIGLSGPKFGRRLAGLYAIEYSHLAV